MQRKFKDSNVLILHENCKINALEYNRSKRFIQEWLED